MTHSSYMDLVYRHTPQKKNMCHTSVCGFCITLFIIDHISQTDIDHIWHITSPYIIQILTGKSIHIPSHLCKEHQSASGTRQGFLHLRSYLFDSRHYRYQILISSLMNNCDLLTAIDSCIFSCITILTLALDYGINTGSCRQCWCNCVR